MSVELEVIQYDTLQQKIDSQISKLDTQITKLNDIISRLDSQLTKMDTQITKFDTIITKLDSIIASLGAPEKTYAVSLTASAVAANKHHLVLWNGSATPIKVRAIVIFAEVTATVTGFQMGYRLFRVTSVTGGTSLTIAPFDPTDTVPSGISAVTAPTSITTGHLLHILGVNPEETGGQHLVEIDFSKRGVKPIIVPASQGITLQQYGTAGTGTLSATMIFSVP